MKVIRLLILSAVLLLMLAACTSLSSEVPFPTPDRPITGGAEESARTDEQGAVAITVTPLNLTNPTDTLDFQIVLDTHSVELNMDLTTMATLTTDTGISATPTMWDGSRGGHHVSGTLSFRMKSNGKSLLDGVKRLTLTIRGVDVPERVFVWELGS